MNLSSRVDSMNEERQKESERGIPISPDAVRWSEL